MATRGFDAITEEIVDSAPMWLIAWLDTCTTVTSGSARSRRQ
jgi:hypothetical protein